MPFTHRLDRGVLIIELNTDIGVDNRAEAAQCISQLVRAYMPQHVVIGLMMPSVSAATLSTVVRSHRLCGHLSMTLSVATCEPGALRLLESKSRGEGNGDPLLVFPHVSDAINAVTRGLQQSTRQRAPTSANLRPTPV